MLHRRGPLGRALRAGFIVAVALVGAWLGVLVGGRASVPVGPVDTTMSLQPSLRGNSLVEVAPLGTVEFDSHDGPLRVLVTIDAINAAAAREIFDDPRLLEGVEERISADLRDGVRELLVRGLISGALGGFALGWLALRPRRRGVVTSLIAAGALCASGGVAAATLDESSIVEPHYTGLLAGASTFLGTAETIAANVDAYRNGLASLVANVSQLYDVTSTLDSYEPNDDVTRVLHISDLHLNPTAWAIIRSVVNQFGVDVVADTGDIVHQGTAFESAYVQEISTLGVPYVFVRGNHDSMATVRAIESEPNAVVLDGTVEEVAGVRFLGVGDPRFTPDKTRADQQEGAEVARAQEVVEELDAVGTTQDDIDIALMHHPAGARVLDGLAPYILTGHMHTRARELLPAGSWLFQQGSTGASGPNALRNEDPTPITLTVLYLDADTHELEAWDDITLGGLGLASAEIERRLASSFVDAADAAEEPDEVVTPAADTPTTEPAATDTPFGGPLNGTPTVDPTDSQTADEGP